MTHNDALTILKTGVNVFITGEPGSGKTHTILEFIKWLREHDIEPAITASTGIAATHIGGYTIHSWSGIGISSNLSDEDIDNIGQKAHIVRRIRKAHVLIIDEVSMLSAHTLEMIDAVCRFVRHNEDAFGGLQIILAGDFFQLPPVYRSQPRISSQRNLFATDSADEENGNSFAFLSPVWERAHLIVCYLTEQYRQEEDISFYKLLAAIRHGTVTSEHEEMLTNRQCIPPDNVPILLPHISTVDTVNAAALKKLSGKIHTFIMTKSGSKTLTAHLVRGCLSPEELVLKEDAAVMFTKNNPSAGFANGTIGTIVAFENTAPVVQTRDGRVINVQQMDWVIEENGAVLARITQMPLRLAWAITVHKSQGMSLDAAHIDLSHAFEYGQGYVALSRVRSFSGLTLRGFNHRALEVHPTVHKYDISFQEQSKTAWQRFAEMSEDEIHILQKAYLHTIASHSIHTKTKEQSNITKDNKENDNYI